MTQHMAHSIVLEVQTPQAVKGIWLPKGPSVRSYPSGLLAHSH